MLVSALSVINVDALPTSYFASSSRLGSGHWVKIKVTENGMQELSFDTLRQLGFEDPANVAVFGYPSWTMGSYLFDTSLPDDLPVVTSAIYGDKLVFYGEACVHSEGRRVNISGSQYYGSTIFRNLDGKESFYYLTDSYSPVYVKMREMEVEETYPYITQGFGICAVDYRKRFPGAEQIGAYLVGDNCATSAGVTTQVHLPSFMANSYPALISAGVTTFSSKSSQSFIISLGESSATKYPAAGYGTSSWHKTYFYTEVFSPMTSTKQRADHMYPLTLKLGGTSPDGSELAFDYFTITYPRSTALTAASQEMMLFPSVSQSQGIVLTDATESTKIWNISNSMAPFEMELTDVDNRKGVVADRTYYMNASTNGLQIVAFDPTQKLIEPEIVGEVPNQDLHSIEVPEMLIVSSAQNMEESLRLAELHRIYTGTDVKVVEFGQVCNEFGSGSRHPMAIRRMVKMLYDRDPNRFKALLLMGRAPRDNNGAVITESPEQFNDIYVPLLHCEDITLQPTGNVCGQDPTSYGTDAIYGMLNDDFTYSRGTSSKFLLGGANIQVGRIPAYDKGDAIAYVNKVERYLSSPASAPLWNSAMVYTDQGDGNMHINQGETLRKIINQNSPSTTTVYFTSAHNNDAAANTRLLSALSRGVSYWHYIGHSGGASAIVGWDTNKNKEVDIQYPPFTMFATCQTQILDAQSNSLQVAMLFKENGGMMGGVGSIRPVYANYNLVASHMCALGYYTQEPGATFGQVWQTGRNILATDPSQLDVNVGTAAQINTLSFNFIGDPMLPLRVPEGFVGITTINGSAVTNAPEVASYEPQQFEGAVFKADGSVDTSFNGKVTLQVYDGNFTATIPGYSYNNGTSTVEIPARDLNYDDYLMQQAVFDVKDGRFTGALTFALPYHDGTYNRLTLFAQSDDLHRTSVGTLNKLKIVQQNEIDLTNIELPEITNLYAIDASFKDGDCVPADFMVYADVEMGTLGLVGASDHIGGAMMLSLDNHKRYSNVDSYFTLDTNGNGHLAMPLKEISDGHHTLTFSVADLSGESVSRSIDFVVANVTEGSIILDKEFTTDQAVIDIHHGYDLETSGRVVISDPAGKVVFSQENASFPFTWNLTDNEGNDVNSGIYSAMVYFKAERRHGFAAPVRIIVGQK